jgi:hypothetical protein
VADSHGPSLAHLRIAVRLGFPDARRKVRYRPAGLSSGRTGFAPAGELTEFHEAIATSFLSGQPFLVALKNASRERTENTEQKLLVPSCAQPAVLDSDLRALDGLEKIESDVSHDGEVIARMRRADTAIVFTTRDIEHPVKSVLDSPVTPCVGQGVLRGQRRTGADVVALFLCGLPIDSAL